MKYMLLVRSNRSEWAEWDDPSDDALATMDFMARLNAELLASGEFVDAAGLANPVLAKTVRNHDDASVITDGPYSEAKEVLGGYWVLDCESYDRALAIAARVVEFGGHGPDTVEVRPIMTEDRGLEM
ncbi:MAG: hypothetical protein GEU86_21985 [Actinophytocola sp.]|nr:hypothetical protein [Actinophytocola sp.]